MNNKPIGIFDSGVGGLTVASAISEKLPHESITYLGDTMRVPYGTRSPETVCRFAKELTSYLLQNNVKLLVIACNTISALCRDEITKYSRVPVVDVVTPTIRYVASNPTIKRVGVIGTSATIQSGEYERLLKKYRKDINFFSKACPLFVPLVESGFTNHQATKLLIKEYLQPLIHDHIDSLVLACTHYPLLKPLIRTYLGKEVRIIDSAHPTAEAVYEVLNRSDLLNTDSRQPIYRLFFTDLTKQIKTLTSKIWINRKTNVKKVSLTL
jgi:glutamate racemase